MLIYFCKKNGFKIAGDGITVTVFDTGVDKNHSELSGRYSSDSATNGGTDSEGHGTFIAGVVAANRNGVGMHGIAFNSKVASVLIDDYRSISNFSQAIIDTKGTVINNSWELKLPTTNLPTSDPDYISQASYDTFKVAIKNIFNIYSR